MLLSRIMFLASWMVDFLGQNQLIFSHNLKSDMYVDILAEAIIYM